MVCRLSRYIGDVGSVFEHGQMLSIAMIEEYLRINYRVRSGYSRCFAKDCDGLTSKQRLIAPTPTWRHGDCQTQHNCRKSRFMVTL